MRNNQASKRERRKFTGEFKARVALEALKAQETLNQIAARHEVHPHQVAQWKRQLHQAARVVFEAGPGGGAGVPASREPELYEQIGRLKMELEWLKKKLGGLVA